jgi:type I restriction enzyme S subunit
MPDVGRFSTPRPPLPEQDRIVAFVREQSQRIHSLIAKKELLVEMLQEKRAALITRAVTKGLDPTVPMKDSGVEWLAQIPAHWRLTRLKRITTGVEQGWSPLCENRQADEDEWGVLKAGCVNGAAFNETEHKALPADEEPPQKLEIKPRDILMSRANTRQLLGSAALVRHVRPKLLLCDKLYRIRVRPDLLSPDFLVLAFGTASSRFQFEREATGASASMLNISQQVLLDLVLPCPPLREQLQIVERVEAEASLLAGLVSEIVRAIDRLKELRTALISAAVTGKIDVRAA